MTSPHKRRNMDIMKLMMSDYRVDMGEDDGSEFYVDFSGPSDSAYEGGEWKVHVELPAEYPFRSPSIGFKNRMYHPNVDLRSGTICLDVINQTWSPMYDLVNVFEVFLPQLLHYPNPADPLNSEAATLLLENPEKYKQTVKQYVQLYAKKTGEPASASEILKSSNQGLQTSSENAAIANSVNCGSESGLSKVVGSVNVSLPGCGNNNVTLGNASSFPTSHSNGNMIMQAKEIEIEWQNGGNGDMRSLSFDDGDDRITFDMEI